MGLKDIALLQHTCVPGWYLYVGAKFSGASSNSANAARVPRARCTKNRFGRQGFVGGSWDVANGRKRELARQRIARKLDVV